MPSFRRIYLYLASFLSLETALWGMIVLIRDLPDRGRPGFPSPSIAGALSLSLLGILSFALHWRLIQRRLKNAPEELSSRLHVFSLYTLLFALLLPAVLGLLALVNRLLLTGLGVASSPAAAEWTQPLVVLALNGLAAALCFWTLRKDRLAASQTESQEETLPGDETPFKEGERLFRYAWLTAGLAMVILGAALLLLFFVEVWSTVGNEIGYLLANGLALLIVGLPIWLTLQQITRTVLKYPEEQGSLIRTTALYTIVFLSLGSLMTFTGLALYIVWRQVLGEAWSLSSFALRLGRPLSAVIPLGTAWAFYRRSVPTGEIPFIRLKRFWLSEKPHEDPQRAGLIRLYGYLLALFGLTAGFSGVHQLVSFLLAVTIGAGNVWGLIPRDLLASSLAALTTGIPVWFLAWRYLLEYSRPDSDAGDAARRSPVRKAYLYLISFIGAAGAFASLLRLLFVLLSYLLGETSQGPLLAILQEFSSLVLFGLLTVYHVHIIRVDVRRTERVTARKLAQFPVLVLAPGLAEPDLAAGEDEDDTTPFSQFAFEIVKALKQYAPEVPVAVHPYQKGTPDETLSSARAVILPVELVTRPSEALRLWLQGFPGVRIVVPEAMDGWYWISGTSRSLPALARKAAQTVRHLAIGEVKL